MQAFPGPAQEASVRFLLGVPGSYGATVARLV
jgi:hypothetical protein